MRARRKYNRPLTVFALITKSPHRLLCAASVRVCVFALLSSFFRRQVALVIFSQWITWNSYLVAIFLSFRKRCKSRRPRKNHYQQPAFAVRSPVRNSCHRSIRVFRRPKTEPWGSSWRPCNRPATAKRTWWAPAGRRTTRREYIRTGCGVWHSWGRSCCTVVFVVLFRADNRTAVKPDQTFAKVEITVKDRDESVSMAHVDASQYKKLIIEDLTSTGKRTSGDTRSAGPRRASRQNRRRLNGIYPAIFGGKFYFLFLIQPSEVTRLLSVVFTGRQLKRCRVGYYELK